MEYEKPISEKTLNDRSTELGAARVTLAGIEANIIHTNYFTAYDGAAAGSVGLPGAVGVGQVPESLRLITYCVLTLRNGFTVTGQSACADPKNFDYIIGRSIARGDAIRQVWPLMAYELRTKLSALEGNNIEDLDEALTRLTAYSLGNPEAFRTRDAKIILEHVTAEENADGTA